jgi:hypothetical protein
VFAQRGQLNLAGDSLVRELAVFEAGLSTLNFQAFGANVFYWDPPRAVPPQFALCLIVFAQQY